MARIAIFAGHGGADPGAVSGNLREKDFTLAISNAMARILRSWGYTVISNRTTDVDRSITRDANLANSSGVDALVEIHLNSNVGTPGTGSEAFISQRNLPRARELAQALVARMASLGFVNRGVHTSVNAQGQDRFGILRLTNVPAVLMEVAFINNPQDMARLNVEQVALALASGVRDVFPIGTGGLPAFPGVSVRVGERSEAVRQIQRCLNRVRTRHPAIRQLNDDGIFGPLTLEAVTTFQRLFGLAQDGVVGPLTWAALSRECAATGGGGGGSGGGTPPFPGTSIRIGARGADVERIQRCLNAWMASQPAMRPLNVDGIFGQITQNAVVIFQCLNGLAQDGVVGPVTWGRLMQGC
jgi:N-acetylmuramoyl-L-alanine amidase